MDTDVSLGVNQGTIFGIVEIPLIHTDGLERGLCQVKIPAEVDSTLRYGR